MANYSQLSAAQQTAIDTLVTGLSPAVGQLSRLLEVLNTVDQQYLSLASAAIALLTSSEYTLANLACANGTSAAPVITSATHNFTADESGNYLNITAGTSWLPGLYLMGSISANAVTLGRPCGSVASLTVGTGNVLAMVPNKVGLAGIQPTLSRADVVSMVAHIETVLALRDSAHQQLWVKACGPSNL